MGEKNNINVKIENHGVIPKEEEHATPEELPLNNILCL